MHACMSRKKLDTLAAMLQRRLPKGFTQIFVSHLVLRRIGAVSSVILRSQCSVRLLEDTRHC